MELHLGLGESGYLRRASTRPRLSFDLHACNGVPTDVLRLEYKPASTESHSDHVWRSVSQAVHALSCLLRLYLDSICTVFT